MIFYLSIVVYIASVILALILMITGKDMSRRRFSILFGIHAVTGIFFIIYKLLINQAKINESPNYLFLLFICSGAALSGLAWRLEISRLLRYYLTLFILTFPMFLFSPSMLVNFLLTTHYTDTIGAKFLIRENIFLEKQNSWAGKKEGQLYKIVSHHGIFHKTIARDIDFGKELDSLHVLDYSEATIRLRGYSIEETFVSTHIDSLDITVPLKKPKPNTIERRL